MSSAPWQADIYRSLRSASGLVAIFTPRSIENPWVLAECSAAWILGVPVFSLSMFCSLSKLPAFASSLQAMCIETDSQMKDAVKRIKHQLSQSHHRTESWTHIENALCAIDQRLRDDFIQTDIVVGSGRGGAICGAWIAARRGVPLLVCDLQKGDKKDVNVKCLEHEDLKGRFVLFVEYYRNTGATFEKISKALKDRNVKSQCSVAIICKKGNGGNLNYTLEEVDEFIRPPWQSGSF